MSAFRPFHWGRIISLGMGTGWAITVAPPWVVAGACRPAVPGPVAGVLPARSRAPWLARLWPAAGCGPGRPRIAACGVGAGVVAS